MTLIFNMQDDEKENKDKGKSVTNLPHRSRYLQYTFFYFADWCLSTQLLKAAYSCWKYCSGESLCFPSGHRHHSGHLAIWAKLGLNGLPRGEAEHEELSHLGLDEELLDFLLDGGDLRLDLRSLVLRDGRLQTLKEFVDVFIDDEFLIELR